MQMDSSKTVLEDLKLVCQYPKLFLSKHFSELKREVDLEFANKEELKQIWIQMINKIETIENECYNLNQNILNEILEKLNSFAETTDLKAFEKLQLEVEAKLFQNKTVLFLNIKHILNTNGLINTILLIIDDTYLGMKCIEIIKSKASLEESLDLTNGLLIKHVIKYKLRNQPILDHIIIVSLDLNNLEFVSCKANVLSVIKEEAFQGFHNLKELSLYFNQIDGINENTFKELNNLERLDLHGNSISSVNKNSWNGLDNLKILNLSKNEITDIENCCFRALINLKKLDLSENQINCLSDTAFCDLSNLEELYLNNNQLENFNENSFNGLNSLKKINLSNNKIANLSSNAFKRLNGLEEINLSSNQLQKGDVNSFLDLNSSINVDLSNNIKS